MNKPGFFIGSNLVRCFLLIAAFIMLIGLLSFITFYEATAVSPGDLRNNSNVIPSDHCEGGECCIMSQCSCPNCVGRGEPGGICDDCGIDLCDNCGNCPLSGISPCPVCRDSCFSCGSTNLCEICNGCLDCGHNRVPDCPGCCEILYIQTDIRNDLNDTPLYDLPVVLFNDSSFEILLFAPFGMSAWAIVNILLTIAGMVFTFIAIVRAVGRKKSENDEVDKYVALFNIDSYIDTQTIVVLNDSERYDKQRRLGAFIAMYTLSIGAVLLVVLLQDFTGAIALFDWWTVVHTVLFAGILILYRLVYIKHETKNDSLHGLDLPWEVSI